MTPRNVSFAFEDPPDRLLLSDCAEGYIEDNLGMCVNITSQAGTLSTITVRPIP